MHISPREAAYLALLTSLRNSGFISHNLDLWMQQQKPNKLDSAFAYEIASGSARMALALDYIAAQLSSKKKLTLKLKERALLRTAIYQYCYMDKVPLYAIVNETLEIAKKHCHKSFCGYLNALLRRLEDNSCQLPQGNHPEGMSIRYSYPLYFVNALIEQYGELTAQQIMEAGNIPPKMMARIRPEADLHQEIFQQANLKKDETLPVVVFENSASSAALFNRPEIYVQNITPVALVSALAHKTPIPSTILDLCASPGGKLLFARDLYPNAKLFANDVSDQKLSLLKQNFTKYDVEANLSCGPGEAYASTQLFDLIILDVPCSNSGVLNKRPEARWRMTPESMENLNKIQLQLIKHAKDLLSPSGVIWFLTCSILKEENEEFVAYAERHFDLKCEYMQVILPNQEGWDGGFGSLLYQKKNVFI